MAPGDVPHRLQVLRARPAGDEITPATSPLLDQALDGLGVARRRREDGAGHVSGDALERGTS